MTKALGILVAAGIVAAVGVVLFTRSAGRPQSIAQSPLPIAATGSAAATADLLPAFSLPALGGGTFSAADLKGKPAVVNFFASWCASCWAEIPRIQRAFQDHKAQGLQVLGIGVLDSEDSLRWMVDKLRITYPTVYDPSGHTVVKILHLRSMPTTLFVDRQGVVRARWQGFLDQETLRRLIAQIL
ncbi:MAG: TlpA disulfide reductase family protein [Armatimonadota bacterium]|nr:TlpA disulfide reductase family protein [Armatimonadota bacterium]